MLHFKFQILKFLMNWILQITLHGKMILNPKPQRTDKPTSQKILNFRGLFTLILAQSSIHLSSPQPKSFVPSNFFCFVACRRKSKKEKGGLKNVAGSSLPPPVYWSKLYLITPPTHYSPHFRSIIYSQTSFKPIVRTITLPFATIETNNCFYNEGFHVGYQINSVIKYFQELEINLKSCLQGMY